jgi:hypothetical protein
VLEEEHRVITSRLLGACRQRRAPCSGT